VVARYPNLLSSSPHPSFTILDARLFHLTEDWAPSLAEPFVTHHPARIELFQRRLTTAAFKIAGGVDPSSTLSRPVKQNHIPQIFISKISEVFLDTTYGFFDGLLLLASDESPAATGECPVGRVCPTTVKLDFGDGVCHHMNVYFLGRLTSWYLCLQCTRLLLVTSNFNHLSEVIMPNMLAQLESASGVSMEEDRKVRVFLDFRIPLTFKFISKTLNSGIAELDKTLFEGYLKSKREHLKAIIRGGILNGAIDWYETPQPTGRSCGAFH